MDTFVTELLRRSPLASAVLELCDHVFDDQFLQTLWKSYRGRCYEDVLRFDTFLRLMREALIDHGGNAHKLFVGLESRGQAPVDESNFYRKLQRTPVPLSRAFLRECTRRLGPLMAGVATRLASCFDAFEVIAIDGKTIKNAAKRLKPTRGFIGKLLGAKALVALDIRSGLAVAMSDSLDAMDNEVPLVPALIEQLRQLHADRPLLTILDRQFDDPRTMAHLSGRPGDAFLVRMKHKNMRFAAESTVESRDAKGRRVVDEIGMLGVGAKAMRVRRLTLFRDAGAGQEPVVLLTNLLDRQRYGALDLLDLYRHRWHIEAVFQQVTQTFSLGHLIGSAPQAVLLQFAFCLLLYNLMQVVRSYVAEDGGVPSGQVSMYYLFDDVRTELKAWAYHGGGTWPRQRRATAALCQRLRQLLAGSWNAVRYTKSADKKPRGQPKPRQWLKGGHTSVQRALQGRAKVVRREKVVSRRK